MTSTAPTPTCWSSSAPSVRCPSHRPGPSSWQTCASGSCSPLRTELTPVPTAARERDDVARLTIKPRRTRRERRVGIALGAVAIIGATTSMAVASQGAIPGDALYPVKRAIENTQAGFSVGDDAKGETVLGNASTRLDEVGKLAQQDSPDPQLVTHTLNDFTEQFTEGSNSLLDDYESNGNEGSIEQIHSNAQDSIGALAGLDDLIPPDGVATTDGWSAAHDALLNAAQTVLSIDAQAANAVPRLRHRDPRRPAPAGGRCRSGAHRRGEQRGRRRAARHRRPRAHGCRPAAAERRQGSTQPERPEPARDADPDPDPAQRRRDRPSAACSRPVAPTRTPVAAERRRRQRRRRRRDTAARTSSPSRPSTSPR